jgi:hypothetical protein
MINKIIEDFSKTIRVEFIEYEGEEVFCRCFNF